MTKTDRLSEYGVKEVPDVFICDENGEILYYSRVLKRVDFIPLYEKKNWKCSITGALGDLEDWYHIPYDEEIKTFYFRTFKRNRNTGEDEPLCFAISPSEILAQPFSLASDGDPFTFPVIFYFYPHNLIWVDDENCPNYEISFEEEKLQSSSKITFLKPKKTFKEIKIDNCKERLKEMRKQNDPVIT